jgi:hypothetical protein
MPDKDQATLIVDRKKLSYDWMFRNFYDEFEKVFKSYKCERDLEKDEKGNDDKTQSSIGMPDTWGLVRRTAARTTAQVPNLKFHSKDADIGNIISRTLMYQWDKGGVQRIQKKHVTQSALFGWSVRPWYWAIDEYQRNKRVDIMDPLLDLASLQQVSDTYDVEIQALVDPQDGPLERARLLAKNSRGGLLPVKYKYKSFEGPKCDFLFIGDCYPEPNFTSIQTSNWFIVERRRNLDWMKRTVKAFPDFKAGFEDLVTKFPNGTNWYQLYGKETKGLRERLIAATGRSDTFTSSTQSVEGSKEWTITEMHVPGLRPKLSYLGEDSSFIGQIDYPYDLDGRIAFTECVFIDDLLCGIGDSTARIVRGLQALHDRQVNVRVDLVDQLLRPLVGTTNRELFENPNLIKRLKGLRLVYMRGPGDMWVQGEQAAMASVASSLQDESGVLRLIQMASGESNMSMAANVDPGQNRTATGARIMAYNQDLLTADLVGMFNETSLKADAEMMYLLNRSEMPEPIEFDAAPYKRGYSPNNDMMQEDWIKAEPAMFQQDGEITAEVGSTLADDDEAKVQKAMTLWTQASAHPQRFNLQKAGDEFLISMGQGKNLKAWQAPPAAPPPPPEIRTNFAIAAKWELLTEQEKGEILQRSGVEQPGQQPPPPPPPPPPQPTPAGPPPPPPAHDTLLAASALAAAKGHSPLGEKGMPAH